MLRQVVSVWVIAVILAQRISSGKNTAKAGKRFFTVHPPPPPSSIPFDTFLAGFDNALCDVDNPFRTLDGSCNNLENPTWGQARTPFIRFLPPDYADGVDAPRARRDGSPLPNARVISVAMNPDLPVEHPHFTTLFIMWGQFINHDVNNKIETLAPDGSNIICCLPDGRVNPDPACIPIIIPQDDPFFSQFGNRCMQVVRSAAFPSRLLGYRENINNNTAFIDASMVYDNNAIQGGLLRSFRDGMLIVTPVPEGKPLLPLTGTSIACVSITGVCFLAGDFRANMLPPLTVLHTIMMREHNRLAGELKRINPHWNDERLYQEARKIVGAVTQHITYDEYLPLVLSPAYMKAFDLIELKDGYYDGYDPTINPSIDNAFAAAAYRFGHSLIQGRFHRFDSGHQKIRGLAPPLALELREPLAIFQGELDLIAIGLANQRSRERDQYFTDQVTNRLFENRTIGEGSGLDLLAINIHRGRDNGIPSYNDWREYCGVGRLSSFDELRGTMPDEVIFVFEELYQNVDDIDLFNAGISEYRVDGGIVGPTFSCILAQQFKNLRKGDRFWHENGGHKGAFSPDQLNEIRKSSLARLFCDNIDIIEDIQPRPMEVAPQERVHCTDPYIPIIDLSVWKEYGPYEEEDHYNYYAAPAQPSHYPRPTYVHMQMGPPGYYSRPDKSYSDNPHSLFTFILESK